MSKFSIPSLIPSISVFPTAHPIFSPLIAPTTAVAMSNLTFELPDSSLPFFTAKLAGKRSNVQEERNQLLTPKRPWSMCDSAAKNTTLLRCAAQTGAWKTKDPAPKLYKSEDTQIISEDLNWSRYRKHH